jgi:hypothetical protein
MNQQHRCLSVLSVAAVCLAVVCMQAAPAGAQSDPPATSATPSAAREALSPEELKKREPWRKAMLTTPLPKKGCFTANYPDKTWREVPCSPSRPHPAMLPKAGGMTQAEVVGGAGPDFSAIVAGNISTAEGSFDSATGITSTDDYSLQLNTAPFATSACSGSPNNSGSLSTGCRGWQQFVYESTGSAYIQYWLLDYGPSTQACPVPQHTGCAPNSTYSDGYCPFQISLEVGDTNTTQCAINAVNEPTVSAVSLSSVGQLKVAGSAASTGDSIAITNGGGPPASVSGDNRLPGLDSKWNEAEFNVFGGGSNSQTSFNSGSNLVVRTEVLSGSTAGPLCDLRSFTGESTTLTLGNTLPVNPPNQPAPALVFSESNPAPAGALASCADAVSIGDTHLTTFLGLQYDFQAAGDFLLLDTGRDFLIQTRQVSGTPTWPNADVNSAVAAQVGGNQVAICLPERVMINGTEVRVPEQGLVLPGGGGVIRRGNAYTIFGPGGDSVRAEMNGVYINVSVGLGKWPSTVHGLLGNAHGDVGEIETRAGQVLTANLTPDGALLRGAFPFDELYHSYADSWRVPAESSLLAACGRVSEVGAASRPFYAKDLPQAVGEHAHTVCTAAGVKAGPLLDACTLDVAFFGNDSAAKVFVGARVPVAAALIGVGGATDGGGGLGHHAKSWWWLLVLLLVLIVVILLIRRR